MKKVCFLISTPFSLGGEQRVVTVLANYLINNNYEVSFILTTPNRNEQLDFYQLDKRIKLIYINSSKKYSCKLKRKVINLVKNTIYKFDFFRNNLLLQKYTYSLYNHELVQIINENEFDYVIGVASEYYCLLANLKSKLNNTKIVAWQHSTFDAYFMMKNRRLYHFDAFVKYLFSNVDYYVCQTNDDCSKILEQFRYNAIVINNPNTFHSSNYYSNLTSKNFVALGRFTKIKGFDKLLDAFNIFCQSNKDWKLYLVGDGPEKDNYIKKIKDLNLEEKVILPGKTSNVQEYYLNSSIYLLTSSWEGWGMVATEAMQYGVPVISFDLPAIREIFGTTDCGIIVEKNNVDKFAEAMLLLANDEKKIHLYSQNAIQQVKKFDIEVIGNKWVSILK